MVRNKSITLTVTINLCVLEYVFGYKLNIIYNSLIYNSNSVLDKLMFYMYNNISSIYILFPRLIYNITETSWHLHLYC